jgi:adiponectin receptor
MNSRDMLVHKSKVPEAYHRHYIEFGYRKVTSWTDACRSLVGIHNETMNIWSHLIGFVCVLIAAINLSYDFISTSHAFELFAVETYFISAALCLLLSTIYHWFGCISDYCHDVLLRLDMTGVALLVTGSYIPAVYYCKSPLEKVYLFFFFLHF